METTAEESSHNLPPGWTLAQLGDIANYINGRAFKPVEWKAEGKPIIRIQNLNDHQAKFNYTDKQHESCYRVRNGDVLVAWSASLGAFIWNRGDAWLNQHIFNAHPVESLVTRSFLYFALKQAIAQLYDKTHGTGMVHVTKPVFESHRVPLPPLPEQHRIVAKLEQLLHRVDACRERLEKIPAIVKRFRQSVLAAACSGRLTADWRQSATGHETAKEFLQRLRQLRIHSCKKSKGNVAPRKYTEPDQVGSNGFPELPETWQWASADAVCIQITDGEHIQPPYQSEGYPMLSAKHVRDGFVTLDGAGLISEPYFRKALERCEPKAGDILIVSVGATTGRSAIVKNCPPFAIVRSVLLLRPLLPASFLLRWLQSPWCLTWMTQASGASAQPHLYIKDTKRMPIPIPPLAEQEEIVRRVEALFGLADQIETRYQKAKTHVDKLTQSILAKAFRGELVPQDPNDEPASALLKRIQEGRAKQALKLKQGGDKPKVRRRASRW